MQRICSATLFFLAYSISQNKVRSNLTKSKLPNSTNSKPQSPRHYKEDIPSSQRYNEQSTMDFNNQELQLNRSPCASEVEASTQISLGSTGVKSSTDKTKTLLPEDFSPSNYSVICGNKKKYFDSTGNRRFRVICTMHADEFMKAESKHEKSFVVSTVMKTLRSACPVGTFVTFEKGRWWEVSKRTAREKVGTFFRDLCGPAYKSSSKNKVAQRKMKRIESSSLSEGSDPLESLLQATDVSSLVETKVPDIPSRSNCTIRNLITAANKNNGTTELAYPCSFKSPSMSLDTSLRCLSHYTPVSSANRLPTAPYFGALESTTSEAFLIFSGDINYDGSFYSSSESCGSFYDVDNMMPSALPL